MPTIVESYLRGEWVTGGVRTPLVDPTTEAVLGEAGTGGLDLRAALAWGRDVGGRSLRSMTFAQRGAVLKALSRAIHGARDALIDVSIKSGGTTRSDAKFDIDGASGTLAYYAGLGSKLGEATFLAEPSEQLAASARFFGQHVWTSRRGIALHVNAFNFPAWGMGEKLAVSLLAGVPAMSKPATSTCLLTYEVAKVLVATNAIPAGAFQLICGSVGDLVEHLGEQDLLAFTGSADTGSKLRSARSVVTRSVRTNVEADSLNSSVLAPGVSPGDEAFRAFVRDVAKEMTQKTGQKCTATRRIFVPRDRMDDAEGALTEALAAVKVGDPSLEEVRMGPLATKQQLDDFRAGIEKLTAAGARIVHGSATEVQAIGVPSKKGFFVSPMLLRADAPHAAAAVHAHEVFGPSATLMPYDSVEDCAALVALGAGGLVASIYGDDKALLEALILGIAPFHGRVLVVSEKIADQAISPGLVLPSCVHGGPGRAGGGEELGGERGLRFYMQRTAIQGDRALLDKVFAAPKPA